MVETSIVVVHGPAACGKTRSKHELALKYGAESIVDDWCPLDDRRDVGSARERGMVLLLTTADPEAIRRRLPSARVISFQEAMA